MIPPHSLIILTVEGEEVGEGEFVNLPGIVILRRLVPPS